MTRVELVCGDARAVIVPAMGAGIASLQAGDRPVLRAWNGDDTDPFALACNLLAPFSNRISGGGFTFDGLFRPVEPNLTALDPFAIHGDAFQKPWRVAAAEKNLARLELGEGAIGPWRYHAEALYRLEPQGLQATLTLTNTGPRLPFGGGFHPWFPRTAQTRLGFRASRFFEADPQSLPVAEHAVADRPDVDFSMSRALPDTRIDSAFAGWDGEAEIAQPDLGLAVTVSASPPLTAALVFSPGEAADFFCFEPVMHTVDAINANGHPGMAVLDDGESLAMNMTIAWTAA